MAVGIMFSSTMLVHLSAPMPKVIREDIRLADGPAKVVRKAYPARTVSRFGANQTCASLPNGD
jgi:hypothetical protein